MPHSHHPPSPLLFSLSFSLPTINSYPSLGFGNLQQTVTYLPPTTPSLTQFAFILLTLQNCHSSCPCPARPVLANLVPLRYHSLLSLASCRTRQHLVTEEWTLADASFVWCVASRSAFRSASASASSSLRPAPRQRFSSTYTSQRPRTPTVPILLPPPTNSPTESFRPLNSEAILPCHVVLALI